MLRHTRRLQHLSIFGLTNTGKSRYIEHLVRQDIRAWPQTQCGMLVIDPHGEMFDGLMAWIGANKLTHLPIVPIDLRRQDQIVGYNVLRQRPAEPSVIIDNFVQAMAYVWGQGGTDETPLFERWASNLLYILYYRKKTLADAAHLFTREGLVMADGIEDVMVRRDWLWARRNWKDFETSVSSSINRFRRFLLNPVLRAIFGQSDISLDLNKALEALPLDEAIQRVLSRDREYDQGPVVGSTNGDGDRPRRRLSGVFLSSRRKPPTGPSEKRP